METVEFGNREAKTVLIQPVDEHDLRMIENEAALIRESTGKEFLLAAFRVKDWNRDLSPWKAPAVFGSEDFGEGAEETLTEILSYCTDHSRTYYIGGYSLAGLFALWAASRTALFHGAAAASPSVWFPGFTGYLRENGIRCSRVYLSLGDREEKTRNPVMAAVGQRIRETYSLLHEQNVPCVLEWNEGNHFKDADLRTAKAFAWLMNTESLEEKAAGYVRELFAGNSGGHGLDHTLRVYRNALRIAECEPGSDREIVALAALLHDADDHKLFRTENNEHARAFLNANGVSEEKTERILEAVNSVSFSRNQGKAPESLEGKIVQDADRLDAIGAVGIARTFAYGGEHGRSLTESVQHFYDKLLKLRDLMNTETAKKLAENRHEFMLEFLDELQEDVR